MQHTARYSLYRKSCRQQFIFLDEAIGGVMRLRFSTALITGTVLAVSSLAHAKTPAPVKTAARSGLPPSGLAQVDSIISYCESIDPSSSAKYQKLRNLALSAQSTLTRSGRRIRTSEAQNSGVREKRTFECLRGSIV